MLGPHVTPPTLDALRYGAIRESIAAVASVARYGFSETRSWDSPTCYIVSNGMGSHGIVQFEDDRCVCALFYLDALRDYDLDVELLRVPPELRELATKVCNLALLGREVTALCWSDGGALRANEPWPTVYEFGGELLRHECLDDASWLEEAARHYDDAGTPPVAIGIARRRLASALPIQLTEDEFRVIVPAGTPHVEMALQHLQEMGYAPPRSRVT